MVKFCYIVPAALAMGSAFAAPSDKTETGYNRQNLDKRQMNVIGQFAKPLLNPTGGKVPDPAGFASKWINMEPRAKGIPGAKTTKIRYGPYKVPNMKNTNIMGEEGTLWNYPDNDIKKPCEDCYINGINAGLEWPNGKSTNIDEGMWLHHFVAMNIGPGRSDPTCGSKGLSLPHLIVGSSPSSSERFFSSGNERTKALFPVWGIKDAGYRIKKSDKFALIVDLMNDTMEDQVVYLTITYDTIPANTPGIGNMRPVWLDVAQCLTSDYPATRQNGAYTLTAPSWKANFDGEIIGMAGHLHDGGQNVTVFADGKLACLSKATYAESNEYVSKNEHPKGSATRHISAMSVCINDTLNVKELKRGQQWVLKADYDYSKDKGNLRENGKQEPVMGIAIMYVKQK